MGIEQIRISAAIRIFGNLAVFRQQTKHILDNLESVVAIEHTSPEIYLPTQTPTCSHISTLVQRIRSSSKEFRMRIWRDLVRRIQAIEMRYMSVFVLWIIGINHPLLQLSVTSNLHWRQLCYCIAKHCGIYNIVES